MLPSLSKKIICNGDSIKNRIINAKMSSEEMDNDNKEGEEDMLFSPVLPNVSSFLKFVHVAERDKLLSDLYETVNSSKSRCVLIEGESGCGKTKLLRVLADMCNKQDNDIITVHIGEQLDSKVLIGTFTCSGMPGEFVWLPGILTQSVLAGKWVFLEDIDHTPSDVLSLLLPLVKEGKLVLPGYSSPVFAGNGFRLFATRRLSSHGVRPVGPNVAMLNILENHMIKFSIPQYTLEDMIQIIGIHYPSVVSILPAIINANGAVSLRKLYSLGDRLINIIHNGKVTDTDDLMLEVLDILVGDLPGEERLTSGLELRSICGGMSNEKVEHLCLQYKPVVQVARTSFTIGRAFLNRLKEVDYNPFFAHTRSSLVLLEKVGRCVQLNEPVLLVGETGVGKTATVSYLATMTGNTLVTINLSQQTDSTDLLGGFKPVQLAQMLIPIRDTFEELFRNTFDLKKTSKFLSNVQAVIVEKNWKKLLDVFLQSVKIARKKVKGKSDLVLKWNNFEQQVKKTRKQLDLPQASLAFQFVEGALVEAVRKGWWVLLDEVNLASSEALQCLNSLLEGPEGTFLLTEKLDSRPIKRHPDFRLFCCMNPATDVGKKSLPPNVRNRFSEFYVDELKDHSDLRILITRYLSECTVTPPIINGIIKFYTAVRELAVTKLQDGTGRRPHYSLRTLCRSLFFAAKNPCKNLMRSLYEGFMMSFLTQLKFDHHVVISALAKQALNIPNTIVSSPLPRPKELGVVQVEGFWLESGTEVPETPTGYVMTNSVRSNLKNLARIVFGRKLPVLLQGPTSAGKTSLIRYLACLTGHKCLRVNNHEHTDLQEYVGMYSAGPDGQLVFQEGVLVEAMRNGYWIILDELNLAPTDVLEALNRVLDDNRELFIPETLLLIKAHPHFMLFGTQNPPGVYGGRKVLSRAFRNRFVELHFEDIPSNELVHILNQCSALPEAYAKKMVSVMKNLQQRRSMSGVFEGKYGLITLRDLFRWAGRYRLSSAREKFYDWEQHLAEDGFMLLSGRLRNEDEIIVIKEVIEKQFKRTVNQSNLFSSDKGNGGLTTDDSISLLRASVSKEFEHVVWTPELMRMGVLVHRAVKFQEPVLLVGNTGCGKTTLCQLLMKILNKNLYIVNCHMHTEAADFLGGLRPVRNRTEDTETDSDSDPLALFEWCDGILVKSMREGGCVLLDEISLAEDAVLERLNSVLEPERKLLVAERGKDKEQVYEVVAQDGFLLLATMNPGGDYGKKELSPALRNRFVEIWCQDISTTTGYRMIIDHNLTPSIKELFPWSDRMMEFIDWLKKLTHSSKIFVTTRDVIMWITFINKVTPPLSPPTSFYHGAQSMFVDAIGCGGCGLSERKEGQDKCEETLHKLMSDFIDLVKTENVEIREDCFGIDPFYIERGPLVSNAGHYCLTANGPLKNAFRLLRAMQLGRPLMLEGDPGVGKTSIVSALAAAGGHSLTRINLSEHTDISDLFGSDLPTEGESGGKKMRFAWRDGPFLKALKNSEWILLDEMNLASQSVLEGLNACLDHRGEVFIPELNKTFSVPKGTRLFACQNPYRDGGGRKGLPKSFVNRFIQVYMEPMSHDDLVTITCSLYPDLDQQMIQKMVVFNNKVRNLVSCHGDTQGCDFNLRDILRWCELIKNGGGDYKRCINNPGEWLNLLYLYRIRNNLLRKEILLLFTELFGEEYSTLSPPGQHFIISDHKIQIGSTCLTRGHYRHGDDNFTSKLLPCQLPLLDAILQSVSMNWMTILVGDGCSGKATLIKSLAHLTGHKLLEYPMNTATDTMELLGGYEQVNISRHCCNLVSSLLDITKCMYTEQLLIGNKEEQLVRIIEQLIPFSVPRVTSLQDDIDDNDLANQILEIRMTAEELLRISNQTESKYINDLESLLCKTDEILSKVGVACGGQFEWVDSLLVNAITEGHWMMLSHANFCSSSVLDRLNPLFEPNPVLSIDERGVVNGRVLTVTPHPDFRLFLTLDPTNGEISRALRNRGVEIVILEKDSQDLCNSLVSLTVFPSIRDLSLTPVVAMVTSDIQPLTDLVKSYQGCFAMGIMDLLKVKCVLKTFLNSATMEDYNERGVALKNLTNQVPCNEIMGIILQTGWSLLEDSIFIEMTSQIRELMQSELGCRYDGFINFKQNERIMGVVNCLPDQKQLVKKLDSLLLYCTVKRLSLFNKLMNNNKTIQSRETRSTGVLPKGTMIKLSVFVTSYLTSVMESINGTDIIEIEQSQMSRAVDVLMIFIDLFHCSSCTLSLFGVAWSMFKQHCIEILLPSLTNKESLVSQLQSLSDLDSLTSNETKVLNRLCKLMGVLTPPTSLEHLKELSVLSHADTELVQSSSPAPPLYLIAPPTITRRKELLHNQVAMPSLTLSSNATPPEPPPLYRCLTQPALYELKRMLQGVTEDTATQCLLNYCLYLSQWPLQSLRTIHQGCGFLPLLELSHTDPYLQSLNSSLIGRCHGDASSMTSLMNLCHSSLISADKGGPLITLGDYNDKMAGLHCLSQFLWIQGFSVIQDSKHTFSQDLQILEHTTQSVLNSLQCAYTNNNDVMAADTIISYNRQDTTDLLLTLAADNTTGQQRWLSVHRHFDSLFALYENDPVWEQQELGVAKVRLGVALCLLFAPTFLLDPLGVKQAEMEFIVIMEQYITDMIQSHDSHMTHLTTHTWSSLYPSTSTILYNRFAKERDYWSSLKQESQSPVLNRLIPEKFGELAGCCYDIVSNLCNYDKIQSLVTNGDTSVWKRSIIVAIHQLRDRFPTYPDLVQPFTASLTVLLNGVSCLSGHKLLQEDKFLYCVNSLVQFPFVSDNECCYGDIARCCYGDIARIENILLYVNHLLRVGKSWILLKKLLMVAVDTAPRVPMYPNCDSVVRKIFELCHQVWKVADEKQKEREKEEQSLYKIKVVDITDDETGEEENIESILKETFPNYEKDFEDTTDTEELKTDHHDDNHHDDNHHSDNLCEQFTESEVNRINQLHGNWFEPSFGHVTTAEQSNTFINMYTVGVELINKMGRVYKPGLTDIGGHMCASNDVIATNTKSLLHRSFNIYKDPNIHEVRRAQPVIQELVKRVQQVLEEWPDYPVLVQIITSCNAVLSLGVSEPLMKILTGLEIVLRKAQDWESYTSSRLSLSKPLGSLSALILEWRKMELSYWGNLFDICKYEVEVKASQWWFYLYGLCSEGVVNEEGGVNSLVEALQQLMETSSVGEYTVRLNLLKAYSTHYRKGASPSSCERSVGNVLYNVYKYYNQFLPAVDDHIKDTTRPVEKDFKDNLSILRWNDGNYWAIKQASEKSHRTLLHFMKKYHGVLNQPVKPVLTTSSIEEKQANEQTDSLLLQLIKSLNTQYQHTSPQTEVTSHSTLSMDISLSGGISLTVAECYNRMSVLFERYVTHETHTGLCIQLDEFTSDVITTYHELQKNDSVPTGGDKEKRTAAVKLLMMRRKRALADLIKQLKQYGLSYRKGEELSDDLQLLAFTQSLSMTTPFSSDYDRYFYLSVARMVALTTSISSPSKDLSLYHVKCIKGYSRMLLKYLCEERATLGGNIDKINELDNYIERARVLFNSQVVSGVLPTDFNNWQTQLSTHLCQCTEAITDTDKLLSVLPDSLDLSLTPTPTDRLPPLLTSAATLQSGLHLNEWKKKITAFTEEQLKPINNLYCFVTRKELLVLEEGYNVLETFSLQVIPQFLESNLGDTQSNTPGLFEYLVKLKNILSQACSEFREWLTGINKSSSPVTIIQTVTPEGSTIMSGVTAITSAAAITSADDQSSSLDNTMKDLIKSLMLGLQRILEKEKQIKQKVTANDDEFPLIHDAWNSTISNARDLNIESVNNQLKSLLDIIGIHLFPSIVLNPLISGVLPLLVVYKSLVHRIVDELQLCHRTVGKMTSVMLAIFMNLTSKGFCTPQELSDEDGIEGSEFMDIEAGGFDEGEGSKNVNDKVDKDNLDPGGEGGDGDKEEKKENESDEKDNAFEMEEDFEGKMEDIKEEERKENETESGDEESEELEKRMGEVDKGETEEKEEDEELDRNMWAPEEEEQEEEKDMNKESGGGTSLEEETQLVAKEESKRKRGDTNDEKDVPQTDPVSDDEGVVNDIDEYFEAGRDTRQTEQEEQEGEPEDFGDLNMEEQDEEGGDGQEEEQNCDNEDKDEDQLGNDEEMEVTEGPPSPEDLEKQNKEEDEGDEEGGGDGHTQEMEDMEEDVDTESRSYTNSDTVYGVPQSQSTDTNDQQKSNSDVQNIDNNNQEESSQAPITDNGIITTTVEQNNSGSIIPIPSTGKMKNRSRKHPNDSNTPNPVSEQTDRPIKRARLMDSTKEERGQEQKEKDTETKDSDQYQHVTENQPSDNLAWDSVNNIEGGGKNPLGEEPPLDENKPEEEGGDMVTDKEVPTACEYQLSNSCDDGVIDQHDDNSMDTDQHEETRIDKKEEWMKPTESFFASADSSAWASKTIDESSLRESLKTAVEILQQEPSSHDSVQLWIQYETLTSSLSHALCEELRLILQPTQASKLKGDFRTGKRLNMRRIIPYIASNFQNDRIWLRRSKPSKREYQILLAVDDSSSMKENNCNQMAYESLSVISTALQKLECGQLGICRFGESVEVLHPLESPFSASQGGHLLHNLTFTQNRTNFVQLIKSVESLFGKCLLQGNKTSIDISQLLVVLSDGRGVYADGTQAVESGVRRLTEMGVFIVFIILDGLAKDSIVDIKVPIFVPGQPPIIKSYMETFPFPFYIVLRDTQRLPLVLGESLRQWFELVTMST